jgi:hypothetical protein
VLTELYPRILPKATLVLVRDQSEVHVVSPSVISTELRSLDSVNYPNLVAFNPENGWYYAIDVFDLLGRLDTARTGYLVKAFGSIGKLVVLLNAFRRRENFDINIPVPWFTSVWIADQPSRIMHFGGALDWHGTPLWRTSPPRFVSDPFADKSGTPHIRLGFIGEKYGMTMCAEIARQVQI